MKKTLSIAAFVAAALLAGCSNESGKDIEVIGGGFLFNYRIAEATAGLIIAPQHELPQGASIEVNFENPAGGPPFLIKKDASGLKTRLDFNTPPLSGIVANKGYAVTIRLLASNGSELQRIDKTFRSELNQSVLPPKPLTVGPGYTRNPGLDPKDAHGQL
jgi:hypothetical protein